MKKIFYCLVAALVLAACVKEDASIAKVEEVKNPYAVTPDEAVQLLKSVMGGESTRAISVGEIKTLRKSDFVPTTRGGEDGDVIYIVDLENGGSAVMGADKRMEPIYAILDETKISPDKLTLTATRTDDGEQDIEEYVMGLMNAKIQSDAGTFAHDLIIRDSLEMPMVPIPHNVTITTQLGSKYPMLRTKWHQESPFNDLYPKGEGRYFSEGTMIAGCGPIAVAQTLYFLRTPDNLWNMHFFDWELISECEYGGSFSLSAKAEVAKFVKAIGGTICKEMYVSEDEVNPGVNPNILIHDLTHFGLVVDSLALYNFERMKLLLDDDLPVITRGESYNQYTGTSKHMWVIDGYNSYNVKIYEREYNGLNPIEFTDTLLSNTTYKLVHCNYGWEGRCDGYYTSGVFDTRSRLPDDLIVEEIGDKSNVYFDNYTNLIKYIHYGL